VAIQVNVKLSEDERAVLARRAKKEGVTESDYLRTCMMMDALLAGDIGAFKITGERLRVKLKQRLQEWSAAGIL
jgi:hypothetical protein